MISCNVSLNDGCVDGGEEPVRTKCYRCGLPACRGCSWIDLDPLVGRRTRRCRDCREEEEQK